MKQSALTILEVEPGEDFRAAYLCGGDHVFRVEDSALGIEGFVTAWRWGNTCCIGKNLGVGIFHSRAITNTIYDAICVLIGCTRIGCVPDGDGIKVGRWLGFLGMEKTGHEYQGVI